MENPIVQGWYADPESLVYDEKLYIYVTKSLPYSEQMNIDLVVSSDLKTFDTIHDILDMSTFPGTTRCVWAPSAIEKDGKYYIIFSTNGIKQDDEVGGLYIGVSDKPEGPFKNVYADGRPFINKFHNGAQPIDAHFYKEKEEVYIYYGGWTNGTYCVKTAVSDSPLGPFTYKDTVLKASEIADGPGHNSQFEFQGKRYVAYHRRRIGDDYPHHRELCIDEMKVSVNGIEPIIMT